jgi:hypothetical protein
MRLTTWNCKGGFNRKHPFIVALKPDVLVVPEAEELRTVTNLLGAKCVSSHHWVGSNRNKGLAVLSYGDYSLRVHDGYDAQHRWILPLAVDGPEPFTLFAVWTVPHVKTRYYVSCLFDALKSYRTILESERVVWAGDFNQSTLFDSPDDPLHFSRWLSRIAKFGFRSLYHLKLDFKHGCEPDKTFFLHHDISKPHHIDYIFAKPDIYGNGFDLVVGQHAAWAKLSDHMPLTLTTWGRTKRPNQTMEPTASRCYI